VSIGKIVQPLRVNLPDDPIYVITDLSISADLTRQPTLKTHPLTVNVIVTLKLGAITLDASFRLKVDRNQH
jgi:hypothetical protein